MAAATTPPPGPGRNPPLPAAPAAALLDIEGVLWVDRVPLPGAAEAVRVLRDLGLALRFVTNTTSRPAAALRTALRAQGIDVADRELVTPVALAADHCRRRGHRRAALLVPPAVAAELAAAGVAPADPGEPADAVIVGDLGPGFTYAALNGAFRRLMAGAELVALHRNRFWRTDEGLALDAGAFVACLEYGAATRAAVMGKPAPEFFAAVLGGLGVAAADAVMVGDDVETDVGGAQAAGVAGILVRTGKYDAAHVASAGVRAAATAASIADVPALLAPRGVPPG